MSEQDGESVSCGSVGLREMDYGQINPKESFGSAEAVRPAPSGMLPTGHPEDFVGVKIGDENQIANKSSEIKAKVRPIQVSK